MKLDIIKNIVAFCILMENDEGILGKSPDYIMEKFKRYCLSERKDEWQWGLDMNNQRILKEWEDKWLKNKQN